MEEKKADSTEAFIIKKMIDGDKQALKHFFDDYYADLCNFLNFYVKSQHVSEDIVQDIFVHFWEHRKDIKIKQSVKSYLYAAVKYRGLNYIRNLNNQQKKLGHIEFEKITYPKEFDLAVDELADVLNKAVESLPPKCRNIFRLRQDEQLSNIEIAEKLGISTKTVENQITIAYKKLRSYLQPFKEYFFLLL
jgi:RNA polymerase sigma-70 factor (ECF subfamily)